MRLRSVFPFVLRLRWAVSDAVFFLFVAALVLYGVRRCIEAHGAIVCTTVLVAGPIVFSAGTLRRLAAWRAVVGARALARELAAKPSPARLASSPA
jgi:hypothetical protein